MREEKRMKHWLKRKITFTQALLVIFLITGQLLYSKTTEELEKELTELTKRFKQVENAFLYKGYTPILIGDRTKMYGSDGKMAIEEDSKLRNGSGIGIFYAGDNIVNGNENIGIGGDIGIGVKDDNTTLTEKSIDQGNPSNSVLAIGIAHRIHDGSHLGMLVGRANKLQKAEHSSIFGIRNSIRVKNGPFTAEKSDRSHIFGNKNHIVGGYSSIFGNDNTSYSEKGYALAIGNDNHSDNYAVISIGNKNNRKLYDVRKSAGQFSTSLGNLNETEGENSTAIGKENKSKGFASTAVGVTNESFGKYSNAFGIANKIKEEAQGSSAIGYMNEVEQKYSSAMGTSNKASGIKNAVYGYQNLTNSYGAVAYGSQNNLSFVKQYSTATEEQKTGDLSIAMGIANSSIGREAMAFGRGNYSLGTKSLAVGGNTYSLGNETISLGFHAEVGKEIGEEETKRAIGIGSYSKTELDDSVALGSWSKVSQDKGVNGYDPALAAIITEEEILKIKGKENEIANLAKYKTELENSQKEYETAVKNAEEALLLIQTEKYKDKTEKIKFQKKYEDLAKEALEKEKTYYESQKKVGELLGDWQSQMAAVSVGNKDLGITRQITGIAAGTEDTDAVNVAQLKALKKKVEDSVAAASSTLKITGDNNSKGNVDLKTETLDIVGAEEQIVTKAEGNKLTISLHEKIKNKIDSIGTGIVEENNNNTVTGDTVYKAIKDLKGDVAAAKTEVAGVGQIEVTPGTKDGHTLYTVKAKTEELRVKDGKIVSPIDENALVMAGNISKIIAETELITTAKAGSKNIYVVDKKNGNNTEYTIDLAKNISVENIQVGDAVNISKDGIDAGSKKIINVAEGIEDTDVVNVKQLKQVEANSIKDIEKLGNTINGNTQKIQDLKEEVGNVGALGAALAGLHPMQYDKKKPNQIMAGIGSYKGNQAVAVGAAHYFTENLMGTLGVSLSEGRKTESMVNVGMTWKFGKGNERENIAEEYKEGPLSSIYKMQDEMQRLKEKDIESTKKVEKLEAKIQQLEAALNSLLKK